MNMLFGSLKMRDVILRNRIVMSPMCQYSSHDGFASDWHLVHLGSRAVGGAGVVMTEATAVEARGRISPEDLGLWKDDHIPALKRITEFIQSQGAAAAIQLAHAGRKASTASPWKGNAPIDKPHEGWRPVVGPSPIPFDSGYPVPEVLTLEGIADVVASFAKSAKRALDAGFHVVEIHAAHGYLLHEFLSPVSNKRTDTYGGSFENRVRIVLDVVRAVRQVWPERLPLWIRISATDWLEGDAWDLNQSIALARLLKPEGVDLVDCSSGAIAPRARIPARPGFQIPFAERIRKETGLLTGAVGMITSTVQAETILRAQQADVVILGRELLRDPYWALHAAKECQEKIAWPVQYERAR